MPSNDSFDIGIKGKMVRNWIKSSGEHGTQLSPEESSNLRIQLKRNSAPGQKNRDQYILKPIYVVNMNFFHKE